MFELNIFQILLFVGLGNAIRLIQQGKLDQITVEALAKEAGLKSQSRFNKAFKQYTVTCPHPLSRLILVYINLEVRSEVWSLI